MSVQSRLNSPALRQMSLPTCCCLRHCSSFVTISASTKRATLSRNIESSSSIHGETYAVFTQAAWWAEVRRVHRLHRVRWSAVLAWHLAELFWQPPSAFSRDGNSAWPNESPQLFADFDLTEACMLRERPTELILPLDLYIAWSMVGQMGSLTGYTSAWSN